MNVGVHHPPPPPPPPAHQLFLDVCDFRGRRHYLFVCLYFLLVIEVCDVRWEPLLCVWKIEGKMLSREKQVSESPPPPPWSSSDLRHCFHALPLIIIRIRRSRDSNGNPICVRSFIQNSSKIIGMWPWQGTNSDGHCSKLATQRRNRNLQYACKFHVGQIRIEIEQNLNKQIWDSKIKICNEQWTNKVNFDINFRIPAFQGQN